MKSYDNYGVILFYNKQIEKEYYNMSNLAKKINKSKKLKIQSKIKERLNKIRSGNVYDGIATFVRELVQNSYRANATKMWITVEGNRFIIRDNGCGCDKPEKLFTLDYSGFGVGFGEGFNSIYMVADWFKVETLDWHTELDIQNTLDNPKSTDEDLEVDLQDNDYIFDGFSLTLIGEKIKEYNYEIRQEVEELCKYIPNIETYFNGCLIEKENLYDKVPLGKYYIETDNRLYKGKISLTSGYFDSGVRVYFEYRYVQTLNINGAKGVISLKPKAVNLKAPDRSSVIYDQKRIKLEKQLEKEVTNLLKQMVANCNKDEIDEYSKIIQEYLDVKEYINYLTIDSSLLLKQIENDMQSDMESPRIKALPDAADFYDVVDGVNKVTNLFETLPKAEREEQKEAETTIKSEQIQLFEESPNEIQLEENNDINLFKEEQIEEQEEQEKQVNTIRSIRDREFASTITATETIKKEDLAGITIKNIKKKKNIVWCSVDEKEKYQDYIAQFEYNNVQTFISPHVLYDNALRHLGIPHVSEFDNCIIEDYKVLNTGARNKKEEKATELLAKIENLFGLSETFYISDIQCKRRIELNGKVVHREKVQVNGYEQFGYIHLNRKSLYFGKVSGAQIGKEKLGLHDVKFLLGNVDLISHELAHKICDTKDNTKEHLEKEEVIRGQIIKFILENS